jgi:hypothetical protein
MPYRAVQPWGETKVGGWRGPLELLVTDYRVNGKRSLDRMELACHTCPITSVETAPSTLWATES